MKKIKKGSDFKIIINKVISNGMMRLINQKEEVCVKFMKFDMLYFEGNLIMKYKI